jgi:hypothetical protein
MSILDEVKGKLNRFKEERERNQAVKLNKDLMSSKRAYATAKIKEEVTKNKEYVRGVNAKAREQRFAPLKAFGQQVSRRTKSRSRSPVNLGRSPGDHTGSIFTAQSNSPNNIYFKGSSGSNPFTFSRSNPVKRKSKGKRITINL